MTIQQEQLLDGYVLTLPDSFMQADGYTIVPVHQHTSFYARYGKAILDRVAAAVLLICASPVLLGAMLVVMIQLGRPIFLSQQRIGLGGRPFGMLKFRTMQPDRRARQADWAEEDRRKTHKTPDDPRHTPAGRVLRKLSIDELPQLLNVVKGEMSLVGPRPELAGLVRFYEPWQHARHAVRPGLTGLWQTTARQVGLMNDYIHLDLQYIQQLSFRNDMRLLYRTVGVLLRPETH